MKRAIVGPAILASIVFGGLAMAQSPYMKEDTISGFNFVAIQTALPELTKRNLNVSNYQISVIATDASIIVLFTDPEAPPGQTGSSPRMTSFEVELTKDAKKVIRSNFVR
jgi:hypothetical protein